MRPRRWRTPATMPARRRLFGTFLQTYPGGPLSTEAQFRRGEALAATADWRGAAHGFLDAFSGAPQGPLAPRALFRLADSLNALGNVAGGLPDADRGGEPLSRLRRGGGRAGAAAGLRLPVIGASGWPRPSRRRRRVRSGWRSRAAAIPSRCCSCSSAMAGGRCGRSPSTTDCAPESAAEAEAVAALCAARGIPHAMRRWDGGGSGNLQARAREARRALIAAWARDVGPRRRSRSGIRSTIRRRPS